MESLTPPFDAYEGNEPYIFVSYAHKDHAIVFEHITRLHNAGFRIWYDEGIDPGADWSDEIAAALVGAEVFLVFISEASIASHNVRKEIVFAIDQRKSMLCVHLEDVELPSGLKMQLGNIQALLEGRFPDKNKFYRRFCSALHPEKTCQQGEACAIVLTPAEENTLSVQRTTLKALSAEAGSQKQQKSTAFVLLAAVALCVVLIGGYLWWQKTKAEPQAVDISLERALRDVLHMPHGALSEKVLAGFRGILSFSGRGIVDVTPLATMQQVTRVYLADNKIEDVRPLGKMPSLIYLDITNNNVRDVTPLEKLQARLADLYVGGNPLEDMRQLRPLRNLLLLDITGIPITDIELGKYLPKLLKIRLDATKHGLSAEDFQKFKDNLPPKCRIEDVQK